VHRATTQGHAAGGERADAERHLLRVALDHAHALDWHLEPVRGDLGERRGVALALGERAGEHGRAAFGVHPHASDLATGAAARIDERAQPHAKQLAAGARPIPAGAQRRVVSQPQRCLEGLRVVARVERYAHRCRPRQLVGAEKVATTDLGGVE
jgi:hypothetical protein